MFLLALVFKLICIYKYIYVYKVYLSFFHPVSFCLLPPKNERKKRGEKRNTNRSFTISLCKCTSFLSRRPSSLFHVHFLQLIISASFSFCLSLRFFSFLFFFFFSFGFIFLLFFYFVIIHLFFPHFLTFYLSFDTIILRQKMHLPLLFLLLEILLLILIFLLVFLQTPSFLLAFVNDGCASSLPSPFASNSL